MKVQEGPLELVNDQLSVTLWLEGLENITRLISIVSELIRIAFVLLLQKYKGPKKLWVHKILGLRKFWAQNF